MAEYENKKIEEEAGVEAKDRGLFDFLGKKEEEKPPVAVHEEEVVIVAEQFEKVEVSEPEPVAPKVEEQEEKKPSLLEKLHRSDSSSSSVSFKLFILGRFDSSLFNHLFILLTKI